MFNLSSFPSSGRDFEDPSGPLWRTVEKPWECNHCLLVRFSFHSCTLARPKCYVNYRWHGPHYHQVVLTRRGIGASSRDRTVGVSCSACLRVEHRGLCFPVQSCSSMLECTVIDIHLQRVCPYPKQRKLSFKALIQISSVFYSSDTGYYMHACCGIRLNFSTHGQGRQDKSWPMQTLGLVDHCGIVCSEYTAMVKSIKV